MSCMEPLTRNRPMGSDFHLTPEFYDAVGWKLEKLHRAFGITKHPGEEFLSPKSHPRSRCWKQRLAREKEACVHHLTRRTAIFELSQRSRNVNLFHEAVAEDDAIKAGAVIVDRQTLLFGDVGYVLD